MSEYRIQIVDSHGAVVASWEPGRNDEVSLVDGITNRIVTKSVGVLRTRFQVGVAVREALNEFLYELKSKV